MEVSGPIHRQSELPRVSFLMVLVFSLLELHTNGVHILAIAIHREIFSYLLRGQSLRDSRLRLVARGHGGYTVRVDLLPLMK